MIPATQPDSERLSGRTRFLAAVLGAGLLAMLVVAFLLKPEARGWGTHEQLGLPPCTFMAWVGKRCPSCGMTTAWAYTVHLRPLAALETHVTGTILALVAAATSVISLATAIRGKKLALQPGEVVITGVALALVALVLVEWTVRLLTE